MVLGEKHPRIAAEGSRRYVVLPGQEDKLPESVLQGRGFPLSLENLI